MAVVQVDAQLSVPESFGLSGRYYWTWVNYFDVANPLAFNGTIDSYMENTGRGFVDSTIRYDGYVTTYPPRSGNVIVNRLGQNLAGHRTAGTLLPITNIMRMSLWSGDRVVGYRLWRAGFHDTDIAGQLWEDSILTTVRGFALVPLSGGFASSLRGDILTNLTIDKRVHMANLRHGTKRRARKVLA